MHRLNAVMPEGSSRWPELASFVAEHLDQVMVVFERQLASDLSAVNTLCKHVEQYRGKMLRPTLVLLSALASVEDVAALKRRSKEEARGSQPQPPLTTQHLTVAAVVEMIHMATLVHDDVLDEAEVRRRGATVNHLWGNETAVILGDYLISNAFHLCSTANDPAINLALGQITNTLCEGELVQLHHRNNYGLDEPTYLEIIQRKTASLIGECCRLGAMLSGATDEVCRALRDYGISAGVAFQIQDDLLDLVGDQSVVGKSLGKDLDKGKMTLPIIYYLQTASLAERAEALRLIMHRQAEALRLRLIESGAVERASQTARALVEDAKRHLQKAPVTAARELLEVMADAVVARKA